MTFLELPDNLAEQPLTGDKLIADVLDLLVSERDRRRGCLLFALCDSAGRLVQPCMIDDLPDNLPASEFEAVVEVFVNLLADNDPPGSLLVARGRATGLSATDQDITCGVTVEQACQGRVKLLGMHIITTEGSRPIPRSTAAA